ncbi:MAG TPA: proton-conducting transporter membrane subunit, partial [Miltoncostaeaceae bacterium]|nr:proton-conducting transporter membrane subunit [Miltoncostaeaceae bacterium]
LSVAVAVGVWRDGRTTRLAVGGWEAPVGIVLRADGMAAAMLVLSGLVGLAVTAYAVAYWRAEPGPGGRAFWPLWLLLWAALHVLFLAGDVFNVFVALELIGLSAVSLVLLGGGPAALTGALRYLLAAWLGSTVYLLGVALLYAGHGALDMATLAARVGDGRLDLAALGLCTAGLLVKAALFPVHFWLPRAHASAPAPASAALSALVVTAAFTVVVRLWSEALAGAVTPEAGTLMGVLGAGAVVWGSVLAIRQDRLKPLIAYSTVGQLGYLFLIIPLAAVPVARSAGPPSEAARDGWNGGLMYALSHGLAKAALFLAAGCMIHAVGSDRIRDLSGIASRLPVATFAFAIAGVTLIGLPPTGGFVAKWYLVRAAIGGEAAGWAIVVLAGGLLTAVYVLAVVRPALERGEGEPPPLRRVPRVMEASAMALALVALVLGVRAAETLELLGVGIGGAA